MMATESLLVIIVIITVAMIAVGRAMIVIGDSYGSGSMLGSHHVSCSHML